MQVCANQNGLVLATAVSDVLRVETNTFLTKSAVNIATDMDGNLLLHRMCCSRQLDLGLSFELLEGSEVSIPD